MAPQGKKHRTGMVALGLLLRQHPLFLSVQASHRTEPIASRIFGQPEATKGCPDARGVGRVAESDWGAGTLKAAKGLANFRTLPRVKDEGSARRDPLHAIQYSDRSRNKCGRFRQHSRRLFPSSSNSTLRDEGIHHHISRQAGFGSAGSSRSQDRLYLLANKEPAISGMFECGCCVLRPPRTAMSYWHADHNIGRSGFGGGFGRGSPRGCSRGPWVRFRRANCFSSGAAPLLR